MKNKEIKKVICAGGIVVNNKQEIAIVNQNHDSYSLPKGHVDQGESYLDAAKREIYEETGIEDLQYIKDMGSYSRYKIGLDGKDYVSELKKIYIFLFTSNQVNLVPKDPHNPFAIWANIKKVQELLTHQEDVKFFNNTLKLWAEK